MTESRRVVRMAICMGGVQRLAFSDGNSIVQIGYGELVVLSSQTSRLEIHIKSMVFVFHINPLSPSYV